jgi:hypothetical protein
MVKITEGTTTIGITDYRRYSNYYLCGLPKDKKENRKNSEEKVIVPQRNSMEDCRAFSGESPSFDAIRLCYTLC